MLEKMFKLQDDFGEYLLSQDCECTDYVQIKYSIDGNPLASTQLTITKSNAKLIAKALLELAEEN